jgi:hypothetical protein
MTSWTVFPDLAEGAASALVLLLFWSCFSPIVHWTCFTWQLSPPSLQEGGATREVWAVTWLIAVPVFHIKVAGEAVPRIVRRPPPFTEK